MARPPSPDLRPFLSPLLLRRANGRAAGFTTTLKSELIAAVQSTDTVTRSAPVASSVQSAGAVSAFTLTWKDESAPPWYPGSGLVDLTHQLVAVVVKGDLALICASDSAFRKKLEKTLVVGRPARRAEVEAAFVGANANALWLNGVHTPTDVKPNAKILLGRSLEYALDPLGDQSFYYSAVRTRISIPGPLGPRRMMVGAAPGSGRIWINRPADWTAFLDDAEAVLDHLNFAPPSTVKFAALAQSAVDLTGVADAYDLALVPPELMAEGDLRVDQRADAAAWAFETRFTVTARAGADLEVAVERHGAAVGTVVLTPALVEDQIEITAVWTVAPAGLEAVRDACEALLTDPDWVKVYYESGHVITQGRCYASAYVDQPFEWTFRDLTGWEANREKPERLAVGGLAMAIGNPTALGAPDRSLFGYALATYGGAGWLASDDGSMEIADFVHIADDDEVTLIHIKAAKSPAVGRQISVSSYEVVVGQAIKNVRHLQRQKLADVLRKGRNKLIGGAVWHNGVRQPDRTGLIARAEGLPHAYPKKVVVLQPQLTEGERTYCIGPRATAGRAMRMKQLDTLMLSARLSCSAVGAAFEGIGAL